jgi:hypothetical protein
MKIGILVRTVSRTQTLTRGEPGPVAISNKIPRTLTLKEHFTRTVFKLVVLLPPPLHDCANVEGTATNYKQFCGSALVSMRIRIQILISMWI